MYFCFTKHIVLFLHTTSGNEETPSDRYWGIPGYYGFYLFVIVIKITLRPVVILITETDGLCWDSLI